MSQRHVHLHGNTILSSDNDSVLPPSSPPSASSDIEAQDTSEAIPLQELLMRQIYVDMDLQQTPIKRPLVRLRRPRSSSLPYAATPKQILPECASEKDFLTPRTERRLKNTEVQIKRRETIALNASERRDTTRQRKESEAAKAKAAKHLYFNEILDDMHERGYTLAELLDYIFDPLTRSVFDWRWKGFFAHKTTVERIFNYWTTSQYAKSVRTFIKAWSLEQVEKEVGKESRKVTRSGVLSRTNKVVNEDFFLQYSLARLTEKLREMAPTIFGVFDAFSTTSRQLREMSSEWLQKKRLLGGASALNLLKGASQNNSYPAAVNSTYFMATGAQRQHLSVLGSYGVTMGYSSVITRGVETNINSKEDDGVDVDDLGIDVDAGENGLDDTEPKKKPKKKRIRTPGTLFQLSQSCRSTARTVAKSALFSTVYDNINMMVRVAEQILGRKNAQENGTCATVIPLYNAKLEDLTTVDLEEGIRKAPPLTLEDLQLTDTESAFISASMVHTVLRIIVLQGDEGFLRWKKDLDECEPIDSESIPVHKSSIHPLPSMEIDENSTTGNIEVIEAIDKELGLNQEDPTYTQYVKIIAGDQLTIARQRSILNVRLGHEDGAHAWKHVVLMPGLFHAKIADCHGLLETHFGKPNSGIRNPGSLAFHNTCLDRIPIILSSLPPFRTCRDLILVSLYGRVLYLLCQISGYESLEVYLANVQDWSTVQTHARKIVSEYANADRVQELRELRVPEEREREAAKAAAKKSKMPAPEPHKEHVKQGDMVYENANLFLRDALVTRMFSDAVKAGQSGKVVVILKLWSFSYRGSGRSKYAHEMLHLLHNLINVWSHELRTVITQNWLLNPTGKANAFVEIDLVQEHLNFWIKKIYKADGDGHSWDWLALVSPCVDVLRRLAAQINADLGAQQGTKHTTPNLSKDIATIMASLKEHEVYTIKNGRVFDIEEAPATDIMSAGLAALTHGSSTTPLSDFNQQFDRLRERRDLAPLSFLRDLPLVAQSLPEPELTAPQPMDTDPDADAGSEIDDSELPDLMVLPDSSDEEDNEDEEYDEDLFAASPTLTRDNAGDTALDMDVREWYLDEEDAEGDDGFVSDDSDSSDGDA